MAEQPRPAQEALRPVWVFEKYLRMGGAAGEAFTNTLASSGMPPAAVLAREAIQNSVDARASENTKVRVDFVAKRIVGAAKAEFVNKARLRDLKQRAVDLGLNEQNCLMHLDQATVDLNLLYINDHNTTGLSGDYGDPDSKFFKFLLSLGDGGKERDEHGTGGSYGYGKSVYSSSSNILTILSYSRTVDASGVPVTLLFGCGYHRKHKHGALSFTGRAWYGRDTSENSAHSQQIVEPLLNQEADALAAALGFEPRAADDPGTSVLIVDSAIEPQDILSGVEDWWWPRLIDNKLDVRVIGPDLAVELPRPRKRLDLSPYIAAYEVAKGITPPNNRTEFRRPFQRFEGTPIGVAAFKVLDRNENDDFSVREDRLDSVALIRSPLMVVAYHRPWNVGSPEMVGVYIAADEIDDDLRSAEPPAHDRWDPAARRLRGHEGRRRQIVDRVLSVIRNSLKACQRSASPPATQKPKRLSLLERTLAHLLTPTVASTPKPNPAPQAPIHLQYDQLPQAEAVGDLLRLTASFTVGLKSGEEHRHRRVRVKVICVVMEDEQQGDEIPVAITSSVILEDDTKKAGWKCFDLNDEIVRFDCTSGRYDPLWSVRFVPEIEPVEAG